VNLQNARCNDKNKKAIKKLWILQDLLKFVPSGAAVSFSRGILILGVQSVSQRPDVDFSKKADKIVTETINDKLSMAEFPSPSIIGPGPLDTLQV
jgi:hypothetical protein